MKKFYLALIIICLLQVANAQYLPLDATTTTPIYNISRYQQLDWKPKQQKGSPKILEVVTKTLVAESLITVMVKNMTGLVSKSTQGGSQNPSHGKQNHPRANLN